MARASGPTLDRSGGWEPWRRPAARGMAGSALVLLALAVLPDPVHACAVCFDANSEIRWSFLATTIFLSLLPLGMVAGTGLWIRRRMQEMERSEGTGDGMADGAGRAGGESGDGPRPSHDKWS